MSHFVLRILWRETFDLARRPLTLLSLFLFPMFLLFAVGELNYADSRTRVLLVAEPAIAGKADWADTLLRQLTDVEVLRSDGMRSLASDFATHAADLAIVLEAESHLVFERSTSPGARARNLQTTILVERMLCDGAPWFGRQLQNAGNDTRKNCAVDAFPDVEESKSGLSGERQAAVVTLAVPLSLSLLPGERPRFLVPRMLALIAIFLPFILAVRSYLREVTYGALPHLMLAPGGGWLALVTSKLTFAVAMSVMVFCTQLLILPAVYGIHVKPGLPMVLAAQGLAMVSSATLGLFISMLSRDNVQVYFVAAVYLIALIILTDFVAPIDDGSDVVWTVSQFLPLTFSKPLLEAWLFFGTPVHMDSRPFLLLSAHAAFGAVLLVIGTRIVRARA